MGDIRNLNVDEIDWIEQAFKRGYTKLKVIKTLEDHGYKEDKIDDCLEYFDKIEKEQYDEELQEEANKRKVTIKELEDIKEEEEKVFEKKVNDYTIGKKDELSRKDIKEVKRFLKGMKKYLDTLKVGIHGIKKELEEFRKRGLDEEGIKKEEEKLKVEIIDRLIDSKDILIIEHPETREEVNKKNLSKLDLDILIEMMEENAREVELIVNGKITEDN